MKTRKRMISLLVAAALLFTAVLPAGAGVILVAISVVLTVFAGLVPSRGAAKKDPVEALRSE